jgi:hypothetical protein
MGAFTAIGVWVTAKGVARLPTRKLLRVKMVLREARKRDPAALPDVLPPNFSNMKILLGFIDTHPWVREVKTRRRSESYKIKAFTLSGCTMLWAGQSQRADASLQTVSLQAGQRAQLRGRTE